MTSRPCLDCGTPIPAGTRCPNCARHRLRGRTINTHQWRRTAAHILDRDGHTCQWCGQAATTADHVIPRHEGGSDDPANLAAACLPCNSSRGATYGNRRRQPTDRGGAPPIVTELPAPTPRPTL